jgi:hypothetical protein
MASAYTIGAAARGTSPAWTKRKEMTPKLIRPAVVSATANENTWNSRGSSVPKIDARRPRERAGLTGGVPAGVDSGSATDGTLRRSWASSSNEIAPGTARRASPGHSTPVTAVAPVSNSGPANAPTWSNALCTANPRPRPVATAMRARSADLEGLRTAFPVRSTRIRVAATATPAAPRNGVSASSGTETAVMT